MDMFVWTIQLFAALLCSIITYASASYIVTGFPQLLLLKWVCLIEQESDRNTSAYIMKTPRRKYYGLFQIGSEWCKEGRKGGKCDISCEALLDEDIKDDGVCAIKVFEAEGFKYWTKWEARCKGHSLPDIEKCPDWQHPPNRASPPRDKRTARGKRHIRRLRMGFLKM